MKEKVDNLKRDLRTYVPIKLNIYKWSGMHG